jgi:Fe-S cluster assembly ATP-binding protein
MKLVEDGPDLHGVRSGQLEGFSGGEKKRNEILQMAIHWSPNSRSSMRRTPAWTSMALRVVANGVNALHGEGQAILVMRAPPTCWTVVPDYVHVMAAEPNHFLFRR